jgi:hypothetical protein
MAVFAMFYIEFYRRIVRFRSPRWLMKWARA